LKLQHELLAPKGTVKKEDAPPFSAATVDRGAQVLFGTTAQSEAAHVDQGSSPIFSASSPAPR
jgi:hypothetical protein